MNKEILWLPNGYGKGTIIYDKENNPYEATRGMEGGVNIFEIVAVEKEYAESRAKNGAQILISKK